MNVPETFFSVSEELRLFGISLIFGAVIGVCYDIFRTARIILPHNTVLVIIEDLFFLSGYAVFLSAFSSAAARGELRFYYAVGNFIGFILYFFTLGNIVIQTMKKLFYTFKKIFSLIFSPLRSVYVFFREKAAVKFVENSKNEVKKFKKNKILLLKSTGLLYNKRKIYKKKERENVVENKTSKTEKQKPFQ